MVNIDQKAAVNQWAIRNSPKRVELVENSVID
jgi:hypothetical protein